MLHKATIALAAALGLATVGCEQSRVVTDAVSEVEPSAESPSTEPTTGATQVEPQMESPEESGRVARKDLSPEDAVRLFLVAVAINDEETLRAIALPADGLEILLQGEALPPQMHDEYFAEIRSLKLRRLAVDETIYVEGGGNVTMDSDRVNKDRVQITFPDAPCPFDVLRAKNGLWWVNPEHVIAGRRAARAALDKSTNP